MMAKHLVNRDELALRSVVDDAISVSTPVDEEVLDRLDEIEDMVKEVNDRMEAIEKANKIMSHNMQLLVAKLGC